MQGPAKRRILEMFKRAATPQTGQQAARRRTWRLRPRAARRPKRLGAVPQMTRTSQVARVAESAQKISDTRTGNGTAPR
jgi:hypothetical protein